MALSFRVEKVVLVLTVESLPGISHLGTDFSVIVTKCSKSRKTKVVRAVSLLSELPSPKDGFLRSCSLMYSFLASGLLTTVNPLRIKISRGGELLITDCRQNLSF